MRSYIKIATVLALMLFATKADACNHCRRNPCVYQYQTPVTQQVVSPNVYVLQQNYPAPLVGQGTSAVVSNGGYQSLTLPLYDPNIVTSNAMQLLKATNDSLPLALHRMEQHAERIVALQAPAVEKLAAGQAAAQALSAAHQITQSTSAMTSGVVIRSEAGQLKVEPLTKTETETVTTTVTTETQAMGSNEKFAAFKANCAKCHGSDVPQPGGGLFLGPDPGLADSMRSKWYKIENSIITGEMPKNKKLTDDEKRQLISELHEMMKS